MADLPFIVPKRISRVAGIRCALSTRHGGVSGEQLGMNLSYRVGDKPENVSENRKRVFQELQIDARLVAIPQQCHSNRVLPVMQGGEYPECDGLMTDRANVWLSISVADCALVFMVEPERRIVAAVHAGWRGTATGIVGEAVKLFKEEHQCESSQLLAFIGPSAGQCCYEVGKEVAERFDAQFQTKKNGKLHLDLKSANVFQLKMAGVSEENIEVNLSCTICMPEHFHSFRRDGQHSGRMMGLIGFTS